MLLPVEKILKTQEVESRVYTHLPLLQMTHWNLYALQFGNADLCMVRHSFSQTV